MTTPYRLELTDNDKLTAASRRNIVLNVEIAHTVSPSDPQFTRGAAVSRLRRCKRTAFVACILAAANAMAGPHYGRDSVRSEPPSSQGGNVAGRTTSVHRPSSPVTFIGITKQKAELAGLISVQRFGRDSVHVDWLITPDKVQQADPAATTVPPPIVEKSTTKPTTPKLASAPSVAVVVKPPPIDLSNKQWIGALDRMRDTVQSTKSTDQKIFGSAVAVTSTLSVGYLVWLLRAGVLLSSLLSALPAWHGFDPLPILNQSRRKRPSSEKGDALEELFDKDHATNNDRGAKTSEIQRSVRKSFWSSSRTETSR